MFLGVEHDVGDLCGVECALDEERLVVGEGDDVDVLVVEFADDAVYAAALDTDAGTYGVDAVVVGFDGHLGPFAGDAGDAADADEAFSHFGDFVFEQALEVGG